MSEHELKTCTNCEGEGRVGLWGYYGHEVPASRRACYPDDWPGGNRHAMVPAVYDCPVCHGTGYRVAEPESGKELR